MLQREGERPQRDTQESGKKCMIEVSFMGVVGQEEGTVEAEGTRTAKSS